jgi:hypothetical protein
VKAAAFLALDLPVARKAAHLVPRAVSADASAGPCRQPSAMLQPLVESAAHSTRRRVRLVRPDGRPRDEWLQRTASIAQVLEEYCPKDLCGQGAIFVAGCHAPCDSLLGEFPDDEQLGLLILNFRSSFDHVDW